jgi:hypothetical protein
MIDINKLAKALEDVHSALNGEKNEFVNFYSTINYHLTTPEICKAVVQLDGSELKYVPENLKTQELCKLAVQKNGLAIRYVPENLKTEEICQIAVANNEGAKEYFPKNTFDEIFENYRTDDDYVEDDDDSYSKHDKEIDFDDERYSRHDKKRDFDNDKDKHSEREEKNISNTKKEAVRVKYYYCKYCGVKNTSVTRLINESGCQRSPSKKHELYEGSEKSQYTCKYCGVKNSSIMGLVNTSGCIKSPSKRHEPAL